MTYRMHRIYGAALEQLELLADDPSCEALHRAILLRWGRFVDAQRCVPFEGPIHIDQLELPF